MIYLSGCTSKRTIGIRPDIGLMLTYGRARIGRKQKCELLKRVVWSADNGCFKNPDLDVSDYLRWLRSHLCAVSNCLFATAPDVVGDAKLTWERSEPVLPQIRALGFPAAFVAQDGCENRPLRWSAFDVLFIGGTTEWKLSEGAFYLIREAKMRGLHVHMGRVNSRRRIRIAKLAGCDSVDGTYLTFGPDTNSHKLNNWLDELQRQPFLFRERLDEEMDCWAYALI